MSTTPNITDVHTTIPATLEDPAIRVRLRYNPDHTVTLHAWASVDRLVAATTAPVNQFRASMLATPDGPVIQAGILTIPLTGDMLATLLSWD